MAELFYTTDDFIVAGRPKPRVPFLVDKNMEPVKVVNRWFFYVALVSGKTESENTWRTYGNTLYHYFQWLETFNKQWDTATDMDLASYRDSMIENPNVNGKPCKPTTINHKLTIVSEFYKWAKKKGFIDKIPYESVDIKVRKGDTFLKHVDASGGIMAVNELKFRTKEKEFEYLTKEQVKEVLMKTRSRRDALIAYTMLQTGMRREEVLNLDCTTIPDPAFDKNRKFFPFKIIGKGNKERTIVFSRELLQAVQKYILTDRSKCAMAFKKKYGENPSTRLWLSKDGKPLALGSLSNSFKAVGDEVGYRVYPHLFRHTYGYNSYPKLGIVQLKQRMGHSHISTTEKYAHVAVGVVQGFEEDVISESDQTFHEVEVIKG